MIPINPKPTIVVNYNHTLTQLDGIIPYEVCDSCVRDSLPNFQRGKSKHEHLWKAQFDSTQILNEGHIIYKTLNNFWNEFIQKTNIQINFIEPYEIKKYIVGDFFDSHRDNYFVLDDKIDRKINLIIQLSAGEEYTGGDLKIGNKTISRNKGTVVLFPATYMHEVTKITEGIRYSLIGHAWGPNWI